MAHKSKTQRAKATARKQARKEQEAREAAAAELQAAAAEDVAEDAEEKKSVLKKTEKKVEKKADQPEQKPAKKAKKKRNKLVQFFYDVKAEMKRVTWPSKQDVLRWSGVVVVALLFFGIFTAVLDNVIITPALVALSGLGA